MGLYALDNLNLNYISSIWNVSVDELRQNCAKTHTDNADELWHYQHDQIYKFHRQPPDFYDHAYYLYLQGKSESNIHTLLYAYCCAAEVMADEQPQLMADITRTLAQGPSIERLVEASVQHLFFKPIVRTPTAPARPATPIPGARNPSDGSATESMGSYNCTPA